MKYMGCTVNEVMPSSAKLSILRSVYLDLPACRSLMGSSTHADGNPSIGINPRKYKLRS